MSHSQMLSPPQGFLLYQQCEQQDFCKGAEELKSQHPVYHTPPSSSSVFTEHVNDFWIPESPLGYGNLEAFSDVLLSENGSFGPDDLFQDLEELETDSAKPVNFTCPLSPDGLPSLVEQKELEKNTKFEVLETESAEQNTYIHPVYLLPDNLAIEQRKPEKKPKLTLKLKKVKCTRAKSATYNSPQTQTFQIVQSAFPQSETRVLQDETCNEIHFSALKGDYMSPSFRRDVPSVSPLATSPELTLKDALNMEDADMIIESYLSSYSHSDTSSVSEEEINLRSPLSDSSRSPLSEAGAFECVSQWDNEDPSFPWSPTSTSDNCKIPRTNNEDPSFLWSPTSSTSTSHTYQIQSIDTPLILDREEVAASYTTINYSDVVSSPTPRQESASKRPKKTRLSQESRKIRKKEQNKQAAIRYRYKKKQEEKELLDAVKDAEEEKEGLVKQHNSLRQEIAFMKKLMRETLIARKLVPSNAFD